MKKEGKLRKAREVRKIKEMKKTREARKISKPLYYTPRVLSIFFILFLALFSLDVFSPGLTASQIALGLLIHNIPSLVLAIILIISWKYEIVGGIAFILAGFAYIFLLMFRNDFELFMLSWSLIIAVPAFLIGILFLMNWFKKRR